MSTKPVLGLIARNCNRKVETATTIPSPSLAQHHRCHQRRHTRRDVIRPRGMGPKPLPIKYGSAFSNPALYKYLVEHSYRPNKHLDELHEVTMTHNRAGMCSPPDSIPLLQIMVQLLNAKKIVEVGVFTGYTSLGMALALPKDGKIYACDVSDEFASVGKPFWKAAGVEDKIDLRIAPATETLTGFLQNGEAGTFDMGFIDADKTSYDNYYELLLKLLRPGGVIMVDNTLWDGRVIEPEVQTDDTVAIRALNDKIYKDDRVTTCMLPVSDGVTLARKK